MSGFGLTLLGAVVTALALPPTSAAGALEVALIQVRVSPVVQGSGDLPSRAEFAQQRQALGVARRGGAPIAARVGVRYLIFSLSCPKARVLRRTTNSTGAAKCLGRSITLSSSIT